MLIEFSVANFWSFKEMQTLQMQAANIRSRDHRLDEHNVVKVNDQLSLLKSKAIFGANASGKSNVVRAMVAMLRIIRDCLKDPETLKKWVMPFLLDEETIKTPSFFQLVFILGNRQYRYGFETTSEKIESEWLFVKVLKSKRTIKERYLFKREGQTVKVNEAIFEEGVTFAKFKKGNPPLYRENTLFLSVVAAWNGELSNLIKNYLEKGMSILSGLDEPEANSLALTAMTKSDVLKRTTELLQAIDPSIHNIKLVELKSAEVENVKTNFKNTEKRYGDIAVFRSQTGKNSKPIPFLLSMQEAGGTKKIFSLSPFIFAAIDTGRALIIDEFDAQMHPKLTRKILELFHSPDTNPRNAQLIFVTHDTNLLDGNLLRRDQISFTQKNEDGATEIYSLVEFKGVRNDASFEKDYLLGKYGAVPTNLNEVAEAVQPYGKHAQEDQSDEENG